MQRNKEGPFRRATEKERRKGPRVLRALGAQHVQPSPESRPDSLLKASPKARRRPLLLGNVLVPRGVRRPSGEDPKAAPRGV